MCFNYRTKTIVECANVRIDEKFATKEKMADCNSNEEEEDNSRIVRKNVEVFFETNNDLQNDVQVVEQRDEPRSEPREEVRIELVSPTSN